MVFFFLGDFLPLFFPFIDYHSTLFAQSVLQHLFHSLKYKVFFKGKILCLSLVVLSLSLGKINARYSDLSKDGTSSVGNTGSCSCLLLCFKMNLSNSLQVTLQP